MLHSCFVLYLQQAMHASQGGFAGVGCFLGGVLNASRLTVVHARVTAVDGWL